MRSNNEFTDHQLDLTFEERKSPSHNSVSCYLGMSFSNRREQKQKLVLDDYNSSTKYILNDNNADIDYIMPGFGKKPRNCEGWVITKFCSSCGSVHMAKGNCKTAGCPDCSTMWRYERVKKILERLMSYKMSNKVRLSHVVISPPEVLHEEMKDHNGLKNIIKQVYDLAKQKGAIGGLMIYHPWRLRDERKDELKAIATQKDDWMPGDFHLYKTLKDLEDWREYVYYSPHFHIIGSSKWWDPGSMDDNGWIFKRIGDLRQPDDVLKCCMYLLSHMGIYSGSEKVNNIRWFGGLSSNSWSINKASDKIRKYVYVRIKELIEGFSDAEGVSYGSCSECGNKLVDVSLIPMFIHKFEGEKKHILKKAYRWYCGVDPPPKTLRDGSKEDLMKWLKS